MSTNGDIEIAVQAEGVEDATGDLGGDGGGGGGGGGGGAGGLTDALKGGIIGGLLSQAIGPLLDVLNPILNALTAFLAPLAVFLLRLFQPVLRVLFNRVLPAWLEFMRIATAGIPALQELLISLPGMVWSALKSGASWLVNAPGAIAGAVWSALKSGASWLVGGAVNIAGAVWKALKNGAAWLVGGAVNIAKQAWSYLQQGFTAVEEGLKTVLEDIWNSIKTLPGSIASQLKSKIPGFAAGGVVTGPTLATVGEAGPEAIIPLDRLESILSQQQGGGTRVEIGGGLAPFVEQINRDPDVQL